MIRSRPLHAAVYLMMALAACDRTAPAPTSVSDAEMAGLAASLTPGAALTCDFRTARAFARDVFDQTERREVAEILREMEDAYDSEDVALTRELGFDVLAIVEDVVEAGTAAGSPEDGSDLTNAVLACMSVGHAEAVDFSAALALFGAYGVRGGADDPPVEPVLARGSMPLWGAEPAGASATWADVLGRRRLVHASPASSTDFTYETPVSSAYDWGTVPTSAYAAFAGEIAVGACLAEPEAKLRVQRSTTILPFQALSFCSTAATSPLVDAGPIGRIAATLASVIRPSPLHATSHAIGGIGGRASSFSPFVVVDPGAVNLLFSRQPVDALEDEPIPVQVTASADGGTPLPEVAVALAIEGNNASFGELTFYDEDGTPLAEPPVVTTGSDGVADFVVSLNKPGGFRLTATGRLFGFPTSSTTSDLFHVKQ